MTTLTVAAIVAESILHVAYWAVPALALAAVACWWCERRQDRAWNRDTEKAIVEAVELVDDGAALVRETEAHLKARWGR